MTGLRRAARRPLLIAVVLLVPALLALLAASKPAQAAAQPPRATAGAAGGPAAQAKLDALTLPAQPAAATVGSGGVCSVPGIGDLGGLLGLCGAKSGALGDISNINGNCKNPPVPEAPGDAIAGWLEIHPARPPAQAAAFGPRAASTEYEQYGYAGLTWSNYDQPCLIPNVGADVETLLGNWALGAAKVIAATDNTVHAWAADPAWMSALIPIVTGSTGTLYRALFLGWAAVAMLAVAISVLFRANRSDTSGAVTLVAWAVLVVGLVAAAVASPGWAGQQAQSLMGSTLAALDSGFAGPGSQASANQAHDSLIVQSVLYPAWLRGELGDPGSATSQEFGPQLFTAQALSWAQASDTPAQIAAAAKSDQTAWSAVAGKVQQADPVAYSVLTGNSMDRLGAGALAVVTALIVCTFDILASLVVVIALLGVLAGTVMIPAVGAAAMHHRLRHLVIGIGSWVLGMLINAVMWAAAAGVDEVATRALLTQNIMPLQMVLLLLAVLPIALWMIIRRLRGRDAIPRPVRRLLMMGVGYGMLRRGARSGAGEALERAAQPVPAPSWSWRASPLPRFGAYPGGWNPRPGLTPVPPPPLPPPAGPPPVGGGPRPQLPPPGGPNSPNGNGNGNGNGPARGGRTWTFRPFHPAQPGPREYTGGGEDPIVPTGVFGPGERYDTGDAGDDAGFYTGGG